MQDAPPPASSPLERPAVRIVIAGVILGALALGAFLLQSGGGDSATPQGTADNGASRTASSSDAGLGPITSAPPVVGNPAPDFALRDASGKVVTLSDLRGNVVWVNFWATWCVPCKRELPDIQALYDEKHAAGLEVLEVNYQEDLDTARGFFDARGIRLPNLLLDESGSVYEQYRLQGLPDSFFIDREGNLAALQFGFLTQEKMRERLATAGLP
jgi:thiol-disulfide isomerase/thioredoxin